MGVGFAASRFGEGDGKGSGVGSAVGVGLGLGTTTTGCTGELTREPIANAIPSKSTAATITATTLNRFLARSEPVREREILGKGYLVAAVSAAEL